PPSTRWVAPPQVTETAAAKAGALHRLDEPQRQGLTLAAHFGYGAATGAVYGLLCAPAPADAPGSPLLRGVAYGLAVWAGSYLGPPPAAGLSRPAPEAPPRRNAMMLAAHFWGGTLGVLTELLTSADKDPPKGTAAV